MRNFAPRSQQQNERLITRTQGDMPGQPDFLAGMWDDLPYVPENGVKYLENYISLGKVLEARGGCKLHSETDAPAIPGRTGYTVTSTVAAGVRTIVATVGANFAQADEDNQRYFVFDDNTHELITNYVNVTTIQTRASDTTARTAAAGYVRGNLWGRHFHSKEKLAVVLFDAYVYVFDPTAIAYTRAFNISYIDPDASFSMMDEFGDYVYIFNANGIYKLDITATYPIFFRCNSYCPATKIVDSNISAQGVVSPTNPYGRRYIYQPIRLTGTGLRDRTTSGVTIEQMGGPVLAKESADFHDYGAIYNDRPSGNAQYDYHVLTGGALGAAYDTAAEWAALGSNCQFAITMGGTAGNVVVSFVGCLTMADVAQRIQDALRATFTTATYTSTATCQYVTNHFVITDPDEDAAGTRTQTVTSAGAAGTDIGAAAMSCEVGTGTLTTPTYSEIRTIQNLTMPLDPDDTVQESHWTHLAVYGTMDIGKYGVDPVSGVVNNTELYVWMYDIHIARAFTAQCNAGGVITIAGGYLFTQSDAGAVVMFQDGTARTIQYLCNVAGIQVYTATSAYAFCVGGAVASQSASIGIRDSRVMTASQAVSGTETIGEATITRTAGSGSFAAADVNRTFFWGNGTESHVVRYIDANNVEVAEGTTIASMAGMILEETAAARSMNFGDHIPDSTLRYRAGFKEFLLINRLFEPVPNGNLGVINEGLMFVFNRDATECYYSQMADKLEYMAGYHNPEKQMTKLKDPVQYVMEFRNMIVVFCKGRTYYIPTNTLIEEKIERVGMVVYIISGTPLLNESVGGLTAVKHPDGGAIVVTTDPGIRRFDGSQYGENLLDGRIMTKFRTYEGGLALSYDAANGLMFWAAYDITGGTNKSWRYGFNQLQGYGPSENTGDAWPFTEPDSGTLLVFDANNQPVQLVFNNATGQWVDVSTRDGPDMTKIWTDQAAVAGTGGTAVLPKVWLPYDRGNFEHYFITHLEGHVYPRPIKEVWGLPDDIEFTYEIYKDGNPTTPETKATDFPVGGDIKFDEVVEGNRLQVKVSANMGNHRIAGFQRYYEVNDRAAAPSKKVMTEDEYQRELSVCELWMSKVRGVLKNRVTGAEITGSHTFITGPDSRSDAIQITSTITLPSVTLAAGSLILFWQGNFSLQIGGVNIGLTVHGDTGGWNFGYATAITQSGVVTIAPTGTVKLFDLRIFAAAVSAGARGYYFDDVKDNYGNKVLIR